jgi:guanine nucleotide-binding protein subunit alpha
MCVFNSPIMFNSLSDQVIQLNLVRSIRTILDALSDHRRPLVDSGGEDSDNELPGIPRELELLRTRLLPLRHIEALLIAKLVPPNEDEATRLGHKGNSNESIVSSVSDRSTHAQEVFVRGASSWKGALAKSASQTHDRPLSSGSTVLETNDEPQEVLHSCKKDIMALWSDPLVRGILRRRKIRLEEFPGLCAIFSYTVSNSSLIQSQLP